MEENTEASLLHGIYLILNEIGVCWSRGTRTNILIYIMLDMLRLGWFFLLSHAMNDFERKKNDLERSRRINFQSL